MQFTIKLRKIHFNLGFYHFGSILRHPDVLERFRVICVQMDVQWCYSALKVQVIQ
jgi:hypothetical protein